MRKTAVVLAVVIIALFSFNDREIYKKDIRNRLIIQGVGIDAEQDGTYTLTVQAIATGAQSLSNGSESSTEQPVKIYTVNGDTVYSAIKSITEYDGKIPLYSQNRVIVIGRSVAEQGIDGIVDFFVRDVENSASLRIALADGSAAEVLSVKSKNGEVIARNIELSIKSAEYEPEIFDLQLYEMINRYRDKNPSYAMPLLAVKRSGEESSVELKATAVFSGTRLKDTLTDRETVMLNLLCNKVYNGDFSYRTDGGDSISLSIIDSKTKRRVSLDNGKAVFDLKISVDCDIAEIYNGVNKKLSRARIAELEDNAERYIRDEMNNTVKKLYRDMRCDAAGLSRLIYINEPAFYRQHEDDLQSVMADADFNVTVDVTVRRAGQDLVEIK